MFWRKRKPNEKDVFDWQEIAAKWALLFVGAAGQRFVVFDELDKRLLLYVDREPYLVTIRKRIDGRITPMIQRTTLEVWREMLERLPPERRANQPYPEIFEILKIYNPPEEKPLIATGVDD